MKQTVTPPMAKEWLETAEPNYRKLQKYRVKTLTRSMSHGYWKYNGESIKFNSNGRLVDGQHRLTAVVESGVSIVTEVIHGIDDVDEIDTGKPRHAGDVLGSHGFINSNNLAAAARMLLDMRFNCLFRSSSYPKADYLMILKECPSLIDSVSHGCGRNRRCGLTQTTYSFYHYCFTRADSDGAASFFDQLATGENLRLGNPVYTLREFLNGQFMKQSHQRATKEYICAAVVKSWNAYASNKELKLIRYRKFLKDAAEAFPAIIGFETYTPEA